MTARATNPLTDCATSTPQVGNAPQTGDRLWVGDCLALLAEQPDESVGLTVTSPPYDDLRRYDTPTPLDLPALGQALFRVTTSGGVCAVVIQDASHRYAKSLSSFRLALDWCDRAGWRLFETVIYHRHAAPGPWWRTRLRVDHEYVLIFFKGERPRAFHKEALLIPTRHAGERVSRKAYPRRGALYLNTPSLNRETPWGEPPPTVQSSPTVQPWQCRGTVWRYAPSSAERNRLKLEHPATMPDALAGDLIAGFSDPGDLVLDPLMGSGTTCVMAARLGRRFLGMDASAQYVQIAQGRLEAEAKPEDLRAEDLCAEDPREGFRHAQEASQEALEVASGGRHE